MSDPDGTESGAVGRSPGDGGARRAGGLDIILPVAGIGRRCRPLTHTRPKPLLAVAGRPLLAHVLDRLLPLEPRRLVFVTGYRGAGIEASVREAHPDRDCRFVRQEALRGQSDAVLRAEGLAGPEALIVFPDMLFELPPDPFPAPGLDGAVYTAEVADHANFAIADLAPDGTVRQIVEKPASPMAGEAVVGMYLVRDLPRLFHAIRRQLEGGRTVNGEYALADALGLMIADGACLSTVRLDDWVGAGSNAGLLAANRWLLERSPGRMELSASLDSVVVPPCDVDPTASLVRSVVGPFVSVGPGAVVRDAVVRDSVIGAGARVEGAVLERSLVGDRARVRGAAASLSIGDDARVSGG